LAPGTAAAICTTIHEYFLRIFRRFNASRGMLTGRRDPPKQGKRTGFPALGSVKGFGRIVVTSDGCESGMAPANRGK